MFHLCASSLSIDMCRALDKVWWWQYVSMIQQHELFSLNGEQL